MLDFVAMETTYVWAKLAPYCSRHGREDREELSTYTYGEKGIHKYFEKERNKDSET